MAEQFDETVDAPLGVAGTLPPGCRGRARVWRVIAHTVHSTSNSEMPTVSTRYSHQCSERCAWAGDTHLK